MSNDDHLTSVKARIGKVIIGFCRAHEGETFHADDLRRHVSNRVNNCAPGSADRVLRSLRQSGKIDYICTSRSRSEYLINAVNDGSQYAKTA